MSRLVEGRFPLSVRGDAGDPELAPMVTNCLPGLVDEAPPIPRKHPSFVDGMKVSKRINSIRARAGSRHGKE